MQIKNNFIMIKDKVKQELLVNQMDKVSQAQNENVYEDYIRALISQNQQYHIERQVMMKEITKLSGQLDIFMRQKQTKHNQILLIADECERKEKQIKELQSNQIETAKILKSKNDEILRLDTLLQSQQAKWERQISKKQQSKKKMFIEDKVLAYSLQNKDEREKKHDFWPAYNYVISFQHQKQEKLLSKEQIAKIEAESAEYRFRVQGILSILKNQQILIAQSTEKLNSLTQLLQKKDKQIQSIESSNQYLRKLNQSLIDQNISQLNSAKTLRSSRRKFKTTFHKELNTTAQDETTLDIIPQESFKRVQTHRVIKTCSSECMLQTLGLP